MSQNDHEPSGEISNPSTSPATMGYQYRFRTRLSADEISSRLASATWSSPVSRTGRDPGSQAVSVSAQTSGFKLESAGGGWPFGSSTRSSVVWSDDGAFVYLLPELSTPSFSLIGTLIVATASALIAYLVYKITGDALIVALTSAPPAWGCVPRLPADPASVA